MTSNYMLSSVLSSEKTVLSSTRSEASKVAVLGGIVLSSINAWTHRALKWI